MFGFAAVIKLDIFFYIRFKCKALFIPCQITVNDFIKPLLIHKHLIFLSELNYQ